MTRVLITGGTGFLGGHILRLALKKYGPGIHATARSTPAAEVQGVVWHIVDLLDPSAAGRVVNAVRPTHLLHGAWVATPGVYASSEENFRWLVASVELARAFGAQHGDRFVGVGSCAEYKSSGMLCKEDETPVAPASLYGKCKSIAWQAVLTASQHYGFSAAWGRVFLPYGPGDSPRRLIPSVLASLRAGRPIQTTEGYQQRDFVFAPDVANMFIRLLGNEEAGVFNIGTGEATKIRTVVELLAERFGARNLLQLGARPVALEDPMHLVADMSKTRRALGELPLTSLAVGLEQVCHEFETQA